MRPVTIRIPRTHDTISVSEIDLFSEDLLLYQSTGGSSRVSASLVSVACIVSGAVYDSAGFWSEWLRFFLASGGCVLYRSIIPHEPA